MPRILVVEDDPTISKLISASLKISGYESTPCCPEWTGLKLWKTSAVMRCR